MWNEVEKCYRETLSKGNRAESRARVSLFVQASFIRRGYFCTSTLKDCILLAVGASCRRYLGKSFQVGTTQAGKVLSELELDRISKPFSI